MRPKWAHTMKTCSCNDIDFQCLPRYMNRLFVTDSSDKTFRLVGVFVGYDHNWWVAIVDTDKYVDRQLLLYSQFISRFKLVVEPRKCYCHLYPHHYHY